MYSMARSSGPSHVRSMPFTLPSHSRTTPGSWPDYATAMLIKDLGYSRLLPAHSRLKPGTCGVTQNQGYNKNDHIFCVFFFVVTLILCKCTAQAGGVEQNQGYNKK